MALNDKKTGFGFDMEEKFKKVTSKAQTDEENANTKPQASTNEAPKEDIVHAHVHAHVHDDVREPERQEFKQKRVHLLTYESLIERMDKYAAKRGVSRVAVFEAAITAYLDKVDPIDSNK